MIEWAVIADDLTGCLDSAAPFVRKGRPVRAVLPPGWDPRNAKSLAQSSAIAIDCESRTLDSVDAGSAAASAAGKALSLGARRIYKKIDSAMRGPWDAEVKSIQPRVGLAIICPAVPTAGRTTRGGIQHINGTAAPGGDLVRRLGPAARRLALDRVRQGAASIRDALDKYEAEGASYVVIDAVEEGDLRIAAAAALPRSGTAMFAGAAGFAHALAEHEAPGSPPRVPVSGIPLMISASFNPATIAQLAALEEFDGAAILAVPQRALIAAAESGDADPGPAAEEQIERVRGRALPHYWGSGGLGPAAEEQTERVRGRALPDYWGSEGLGPAAGEQTERVRGRALPHYWGSGGPGPGLDEWVERVNAVFASGRSPVLCVEQNGTPEREDPRLAAGLGRIGACAARQLRPASLVICGGATAFATIRPLTPVWMEIEGFALLNTPAVRLAGGPADGLSVITKSGGFGGPDTLVQLAARGVENADRG
ncbi:MAG TPA: four-carbon acid sugar kinase family protein [Armatimonadota bacterium]|nr:four-carbon acid sugar kinase family protein [Armatimonadota bacterium]